MRPGSRGVTPRQSGLLGQFGDGEDEYAEDEFRGVILNRAAWELEDAIFGRTVQQYPGLIEPARQLHFEVLRATEKYQKAILGLVLITFIEVPAWCDTLTEPWAWLEGSDRCKAPGLPGALIYLSGIPYIPPNIGIILEAACLIVIMKKHRLQRKLQEKYFDRVEVEYVDIDAVKVGERCVLLAWVDLIIFAMVKPHYRIAFLARTGILSLLPEVRSMGEIIIQALSEFVSVAVFLVATIAFFAWIAVTIFDDVTAVSEEGIKVNIGLDSLSSALNTMLVAGATDNFVDCFLPTYTAFRMTGLLWLLFLVIVQVLLLNLVLDTLVAAYQKHAETAGEKSAKTQVSGIFYAWDTLVLLAPGRGEIDRPVFLQFVQILSASPRLKQIPMEAAEVVFAAVDEDNSGLISRDEFCKICSVIQCQFWTTPRDSFIKDKYPKVWRNPVFQWLHGKVWQEGGWNFEFIMTVVLTFNFLLVVIESRYDLMNWPEAKWMNDAEMIFSVLYVGEVTVKLSVGSFASYWSTGANRFDFGTTWLLLCTSTMGFLATGGGGLSRYANILRLLRLLRVLKRLKSQPHVQFMVNMIVRMVAASREILTLMGVVVFFFASLSVQLFGGLLYDANPRLYGTELLESQWVIFNFNDLIQAIALWFVFLLCEYVPAFADAIHVVSDIPYAWLLFLVFYIAGVSIMFELVKAFTIEIFMQIHAEEAHRKAEGKPEEEKSPALTQIEAQFLARGQLLHVRKTVDSLEEQRLEEAFQEMNESEEGSEHEHGHEGHSKEEHHNGENGKSEH